MVYVFLATGYEEVEALTPVDVLRRAGVEVNTVSIYDTP
ncbi:MAG: DJ-1/PfpI family protein, partial [Prevotella sp.]|nr:DJ-1/PfpI family protein [Prevotellaceae bacterium]MDY5251029.1 DJ-1/PfpI family protein [Prevotella sp.]